MNPSFAGFLATLFGLGLFIPAIFWIIEQTKAKHRHYYEIYSNYKLQIYLIVIVIGCSIFAIPTWVNTFFPNINSDTGRFWLLTLSGNWNGEKYPNGSSYWWTFSAITALLLNNGLYVIIIGLLWRLTQERKKAMKLSEAFGQRDILIGINIAEEVCKIYPERKLTEITQLVINSMNKASEDWEKNTLIEMYGTDKADRIKSKLQELHNMVLD